MKIGHTGSHQAEPGLLFLIDALGTLRSLVAAMGRDSNGSVMARLVQAVMEQPEVEGCAIFLARDDAPPEGMAELGLRVARGMESALAELAGRLSMPVIRTGAPHCELDLSRRTYDLHGSLCLVGIGFQGRRIGTLAAWSSAPDRFQHWHQSLLELFGDVVGLYFARQAASSPAPGGPAPAAQSDTAGGLGAAPGPAEEGADSALDPTTGLLTRGAFEYRLDSLLGEGLAKGASLQLFYLDVDRYRLIRQFGGDETADRVIQILAETVRRQIGHEIAVGRLGSDEIAVLVSVPSTEAATGIAQRLIRAVDALRMPFAGQSVDISVSVGLAPFNVQWVSAAAALQQAQEACSEAQRQGGGTYQVYSEALSRQSRSQEDGLMLSQLTCALKEDRLVLYAQPIFPARFELDSGKAAPSMHEILVRMQDRRGNVLSAASFLPLAERYGFSVKLDRWVVSETLRTLASNDGAVARTGRFAINLSGHSIDDPRLLEHIVSELRETRVAPERICFEITETAAISDIDAARHFIRVLKDIGCKFALDDFGSGHSSFLYLRDLDVDYLKIEGNIVRDMTTDAVSHAFVRSIDDIGKIMGKLTVAEYVESEEVLDALLEIGIDFVQGYYTGRPTPLALVLA